MRFCTQHYAKKSHFKVFVCALNEIKISFKRFDSFYLMVSGVRCLQKHDKNIKVYLSYQLNINRAQNEAYLKKIKIFQ